MIGSQRDPAQYRRRPLGEGVRLVGLRPRRPTREGGQPGEEEPRRDVARAKEEIRRTESDVTTSVPPEEQKPEQSRLAPIPEQTPTAVAEASVLLGGRPQPEQKPTAEPSVPPGLSKGSSAITGAAELEALRQGTRAREEIESPLVSPGAEVPSLIGAGSPAAGPGTAIGAAAPTEGTREGGSGPQEAFLWHAISESLPPMAGLPPGVAAEAESPAATGFPPPKLSGKLPAELESELEAALAGFSMDEALQSAEKIPGERLPEDALVDARVVGIHEEKVFVDLGVREQGFLALKETDTPPELGTTIQVRIVRFDPENSIYEVALPVRAMDVAAWDQLIPGTLVEARVTGVNAGGLECEVNHIRGFIPMSQIALYRVTNPEEYVGQRLTCVVVEANRERRNLVLSRRAAIEREQEAAREALWASLEPGQVYEGLVRKIMDFGAFVDIGGADGLLHISQMSWGRINHPSEVLQEGQRIKVKILAVDRASRRISLAYRDLIGDPWETVESKYSPNSVVHGKVTRIMPYGAFVELEPGVEGLVHISELAWKKVWRVSDVVHEGQEVDVVVLSVDRQARRISLSMKHLTPPPEETERPAQAAKGEEVFPEQKEEVSVADSVSVVTMEPVVESGSLSPTEGAPQESSTPKEAKKKPKPERPLRGGLGPSPSANKFGLRW
ncbi:MAG: S1 RNA-binding domain-containing protein [Thermoguttaceae bacterium]|nr:S1 RNA-binding domain-containing protein [Thermoguttaceae bacterium]MDW8077627.1 S1 RNA-binding domain-containing protein [Thermoguttaceae bacterium]